MRGQKDGVGATASLVLPFLSYGVGAAALTMPSLVGAIVLSSRSLGLLALLVLTAQVAVALLRISLLIPMIHAPDSLGPRRFAYQLAGEPFP